MIPVFLKAKSPPLDLEIGSSSFHLDHMLGGLGRESSESSKRSNKAVTTDKITAS